MSEWPNMTERAVKHLVRNGLEPTWERIGNYFAAIRHWEAAEWAYGKADEEAKAT